MLIADVLEGRGERPLAPVPGVPGRQPPARVGGVDRAQIPGPPAFDVRDGHQVAAPGPDRPSGLGRQASSSWITTARKMTSSRPDHAGRRPAASASRATAALAVR